MRLRVCVCVGGGRGGYRWSTAIWRVDSYKCNHQQPGTTNRSVGWYIYLPRLTLSLCASISTHSKKVVSMVKAAVKNRGGGGGGGGSLALTTGGGVEGACVDGRHHSWPQQLLVSQLEKRGRAFCFGVCAFWSIADETQTYSIQGLPVNTILLCLRWARLWHHLELMLPEGVSLKYERGRCVRVKRSWIWSPHLSCADKRWCQHPPGPLTHPQEPQSDTCSNSQI